jgi:hypothetical protein
VRLRIVMRKFTITRLKLITTIMSTVQGSSAYSRPWLYPRETPIMPAATVMFQNTAEKTPSFSLKIRVFISRGRK